MSTTCDKERIQHDLTNCLDPSLRLNRYHGDPGNNELIVYYMAISETQRTVNIDNPTASVIGDWFWCEEVDISQSISLRH